MAENDVYELILDGVSQSNQCVNVFGFVQTSVTGGFLGQALIDAWQSACQTQYLACLGTNYTLNVIRARDVVPGTSATVEEAQSASNIGTGPGASSSNQIAALISWYTTRSGRSYRGRTYLPSIPGTIYSNGGTLTGGGLTTINAFRTAMLTGFGPSSSGSFRLAVISRWDHKVERPTPIATLVASGIARPTVATQRRRRLGVGA